MRPGPSLERTRTGMALLLAAAVLSLIASLGCWFLHFTLYWPYRALFDEDGRFIDGTTMVVHHQQSGTLLLPAVALFLLAALAGAAWWGRRAARNTPDPS